MYFYSRNNLQNKIFPYILLTKQSWNDYWEYETLFSVSYYPESGKRIEIGFIKILNKVEGEMPPFLEPV